MTAIESATFRQVLGHFPTGVTVVSGITDDDGESKPVGLAIGSFFSVSLEPPLVGFCVGKTSSSWPIIAESGSFCVNVLAADQEDVCRAFASSGADKFAGIGWHPASSGSPRIDDVVAFVDCDVDATHDAGDHLLVIGAVREIELVRETGPLLFFRGGYAGLA